MQPSTHEELLNLVKNLSEAKAPSGFEEESIAVAREFAASFAEAEEDHVRNLFLRPCNFSGTKPVFMLDAHGDEVGMMVQAIKPNGTLRFLTLGNWTPNTLPSSKVWVRNRFGRYIPGIIAAPPVHFLTEAERNRPADPASLVIDIGASSREEAENVYGVAMGEPVVSAVDFSYDEEHDRMIGKGFDCRVGCAAMLETLRRLSDEELPVDLCGVMSAQEEVGERGATVAVQAVRPAVAIAFEGCPADDTFTEPYMTQTALGKGPMIRFMDRSMIANPRFMRDTIELAERLGIPLQTSVRSGGGNNGAVINLVEKGVPVIVVGVPVRYIHSHYGFASLADVRAAADLACAVVREMMPEKLASF